MSIQRRAFGGLADLPLVVDPIRAMPPACRHVIDFAWRLTAPAIAADRDAVYWQDAGGRVVGLAAWQQAWATLDFYVRPGPDAVTVERDIFAWGAGASASATPNAGTGCHTRWSSATTTKTGRRSPRRTALCATCTPATSTSNASSTRCRRYRRSLTDSPSGRWPTPPPGGGTNLMIIAHTLINSVAFIGFALLAGQVSWLP